MDFTDALKQINLTIAKALGTTVKMTATEFIAYAQEQVAATAGEGEVEKADRLAALASAVTKTQAAATAGATEFDVETYKVKAPVAPVAPVADESGLEKAFADLATKIETLVKGAVPAAVVAPVVVESEVIKEAPVADPIVETPAPVIKAAEPCEWPRDLAAK